MEAILEALVAPVALVVLVDSQVDLESKKVSVEVLLGVFHHLAVYQEAVQAH